MVPNSLSSTVIPLPTFQALYREGNLWRKSSILLCHIPSLSHYIYIYINIYIGNVFCVGRVVLYFPLPHSKPFYREGILWRTNIFLKLID